MANWSRVVNTTIKDYVKGEEVLIMRNRKFLAMLKAKGRNSFNNEGTARSWRVRFRRGNMQGFGLGDTLTFAQVDRHKVAELPWRGYAAAESMYKLEQLQNKGMAAIVKIYDNLAKTMMEDFGDNFAEECYIDGNATGNGKRFHGLESALSGTGGTLPYVASPTDTYANLACTLGTYGGSWTSTTGATWPSGRGDPQYDFWSPILVDYTAANVGGVGWEASTKTWKNTCLEALSFGIIKGQRSRSQKGALDTIFLEGELYRQAIDRHRESQRIVYQPSQSNSLLVKLGFGDVFNWDGVDVTWEYGLPANTGYGVNFDEVELLSLQGQLFVPQGPDFDISSQSYRFAIDCYGNFHFTPRGMVKFYNYT